MADGFLDLSTAEAASDPELSERQLVLTAEHANQLTRRPGNDDRAKPVAGGRAALPGKVSLTVPTAADRNYR
jgi:hypothetical protein